jgi:hypothetical protein
MKLKKLSPKKNRAQAMVEFAIALPILLMLLYGILETGRLLFLYSTIVTASRQAVRYGSATGIGPNGYPRYQECAEIKRIANKQDYLNAFDDADIVISYDGGPGTAEFNWCDVMPVDTGVAPSTANSSRIKVTIQGDFFPIVPKLVPFIERSVANGDPILGISARTIIVGITIEVTNTPDLSPSTPTNPPTATSTSTVTATNTPTFTPTNTLIFTNTPSLTPTMTLSPTATLSPIPSLTPTLTNTPTITPSPTLSPTAVANCNQITHGPITKSGSSMSMTITSPLTAQVQVQDIFVVWNHDRGHQQGGDKTLKLISVAWEPPIWTGPPSNGPSITIVPSPTTYVQPGTSTLTFTFHQSYDNWNSASPSTGSPEEILINLVPSGCTDFPIHATR